MSDQLSHRPHNIRPDEREKLKECRRNAIMGGTATGGLAWIVTRFLLTSTPLQQTFLARNAGVTYSIVIGFALYRGILSSGQRCIKSLATLENSRYGEFARRAIEMREDKKVLSRAEFLEKYPPNEQMKYLDPSHIFTSDKSREDTPSPQRPPPEEAITQTDDAFYKRQPDVPKGPKSYNDLQQENRSKSEHSMYPHYDQNSTNRQPSYNKPAKRSDTHDNLPPGPDGKEKVKRNQYGDVVYEE